MSAPSWELAYSMGFKCGVYGIWLHNTWSELEPDIRWVKIGHAKNVEQRMGTILSTHSGATRPPGFDPAEDVEGELIYFMSCPTKELAVLVEAALHYFFRRERAMRTEWFRLTDVKCGDLEEMDCPSYLLHATAARYGADAEELLA